MPLKAPFKAKYSVGEWWAELSQAAHYKAYAQANPKESAELEAVIQAKIAGKPYGGQSGIPSPSRVESHMGCAIYMTFTSLQATASS